MDDNSLLSQAHRYARQAEDAERRGHWQQAIDKHHRAAAAFDACTGLSNHDQGVKAVQLLASAHRSTAEYIKAFLTLQSQPRTGASPNSLQAATVPSPTISPLLTVSLSPPSDSSSRPASALSQSVQQLRTHRRLGMDSQAMNRIHAAVADLSTLLQRLPNDPDSDLDSTPPSDPEALRVRLREARSRQQMLAQQVRDVKAAVSKQTEQLLALILSNVHVCEDPMHLPLAPPAGLASEQKLHAEVDDLRAQVASLRKQLQDQSAARAKYQQRWTELTASTRQKLQEMQQKKSQAAQTPSAQPT